MLLRPGARLRGRDSTEVVVVRAPGEDLDLRCGGHSMSELDGGPGREQIAVDPAFAEGTQLGKRYIHETLGLEVLCTAPGPGSLSIGAQPLSIKAAKPLPSSD